MSADDKKIYRDIMEKLVQPVSAQGVLALFAKALAHSEDEELKRLIGVGHKDLMRTGTSMDGKNKVDCRQIPVIKPVLAYCVSITKSEKPMWQILAERAGWTPPKK
jgi:hypothetical protein